MIRVYIVLALYVIIPVLIIEAFKHWTWAQKLGTVVLAYAVGIIFALTGLVSFEPGTAAQISFSKIQTLMMSVVVPLAIPLMLFNCDFKLWTKALPKTVWSLLGGLASVLIAVISGYFIFRHAGITDFEKVCAMMTGIYTGGTMNFNALGASLGVDKTTMAIVLAFEMVLTTPYIFFIIGGGYKIFRKFLPHIDRVNKKLQVMEVETMDVENYKGMLRRENSKGMFAGLGLSLLILAIGAGLAILITGKLNELIIILTITTLSIIASFFKKVRELPKTFEMGMFLILIFSVIVASLFDIHSVTGSSAVIGGFVAWVIVLSILLHLGWCKLCRISGDLFCVSQVALLCSPPFVPPVVGAMKNKKVLLSGIVIGLVGYAIGTYLGVTLFYILTH